MNLKGYQIALIILASWLIILVIPVFFMYKESNKDKILKQEFPSIKRHQKVSGKLIWKLCPEKNRDSYIKLNNAKKYTVFNSLWNSEVNFFEFIQIGDSIYKNVDSDSLLVIRKNKEYLFIIED